ncbi:MAG: transposase [Burkholderiaceae bacterium]|nr:transposase [Burkholderiaceae bacterium]
MSDKNQSTTLTNQQIVDPVSSWKYPGFKINTIERNPDKANFFEVTLEPISDPICPNCHRPAKVHSSKERKVRDTPLFAGENVEVIFKIRRVRCQCGCNHTEFISWLHPHHRLTYLCISWIQHLLALGVTPKLIAESAHISRETINLLHQPLMEQLHGRPNMRGVRHLIFDQVQTADEETGESACTTVIRDAEQKKIVWTATSHREIYLFKEFLKKWHMYDEIGSICCDMNGPMTSTILDCFPNTKTLYDPFYLLNRFQNDVISIAKQESLEKSQPLLDNDIVEKGHPVRSVGGYSWNLKRVDHTIVHEGQKLLSYMREDNDLLSLLYPISQMIRQSWECEKWHQGKDLLLKCPNMLTEIAHKFNFPPANNFVYVMKVYEKEIMNNLVRDYSINRRHETNHKKKIFALVKKKCPYGRKERNLRLKAAFPGKEYSPLDRLKPGQAFLETRTWEF